MDIPLRLAHRSVEDISEAWSFLGFRLVSWDRRNGKDDGKYYSGLYKDYYKDAFLHALLTKGKLGDLVEGQGSPMVILYKFLKFTEFGTILYVDVVMVDSL